jgi:hypothetical protein
LVGQDVGDRAFQPQRHPLSGRRSVPVLSVKASSPLPVPATRGSLNSLSTA